MTQMHTRATRSNMLRTQRGFTTVDLVVALAVAGIVMSMTFKTLDRLVPQWRARQAAMDIASSLRLTRQTAIRSNADQIMPFDSDNDRFAVTVRGGPNSSERFVDQSSGKTLKVVHLPDGVEFTRPDGTANEAITLSPPGNDDEAAVFDEKGRLWSVETPGYVYVGNPKRSVFWRVSVDMAGNVKVQKYRSGAWV